MRTQQAVGPLVRRVFSTAPLALAISMLVCSGWTVTARATTRIYTMVLSGSQEGLSTPAFGGGIAIIDTDANTLRFEISFADLSAAETAAHIHGPADPGVPAGIVFALPAGNPKIGVWNYPEAMEADILAGKMYVNIHSGNHPAGEIRGQITSTTATLDGAQETPATGSNGRGEGIFNLDTQANQLKYYISFEGLTGTETAAHIHGFALHGVPAGVIHTLPLGSPKIGVFNYSEPQEEALVSGQAYVNIHSTAHPDGEIRGQIVGLVVPMDGAQQVPAAASTAGGMGLVSFDRNQNALSFYIWVGGLSSAETVAHIHGFAPRGMNAGVQLPLPLGSRKLGLWNYGAANQPAVFAGTSYFNVHSMSFPDGEIRGQIEGFYRRLPVDAPELESGPTTFGRAVPNPFADATTIQFDLKAAGAVRVAIYDARGRLVRTLATGDQGRGPHRVSWDGLDQQGRAASAGVYRYVVETARGRETGPLTLLR